MEHKLHNYQGAIEYCDRQVVRGWAIDAKAPARPVSIQVMQSDRLVAEFDACIFRWDLIQRFHSSGNHGFYFPWPAQCLADGGSFTFRFAGSGEALDKNPVRLDGPAERMHARFETSDLTGHRVLMLAPHPDDETLTCGGTLILHADHGDAVKVLFLTDGSRGDFTQTHSAKRLVTLRKHEAVEACRVLGISDLEFWGFADRQLPVSGQAMDRLCKLLLDYKPTLIYAPSPQEFHPDHRAAAELIWHAATRTRIDAQIAFYESNQPIVVNRLVDVSAVQERKAEACECYRTQLRHHPYADAATSLSRYRALPVAPAVTHAEGFFVVDSAEIVGHPLDWFTVRQRLPVAELRAAERPLVSIVVRTKDRPSLLREALSSIFTQTYPNLEVVLVNDGLVDVSTIAGEFAQFFPIHVVATAGAGRTAAANAGARYANGKYLNFLDDDDLLYSMHIERLVSFLEHTGARVAYSDCERVRYEWAGEEFKLSSDKPEIQGVQYDRDRLYYHNFIPFMTAVFEKSLAEEIGFFDENLEVLEDWDFWIRAARITDFQRLPGVTARYRFFMERPHADLAARVHSKHLEDWANREDWTRERIQSLLAENVDLAEQLAAATEEHDRLRGTLSAQVIRRLRNGHQPESPPENDDWRRGMRCVPLEGWRKHASTPWSMVESLQERNLGLRCALTSIESRTKEMRENALLRIFQGVPKPIVRTAHRIYRRGRDVLSPAPVKPDDQVHSVEVRSYVAGDEEKILDLFEASFGHRRGLRHWEWKYLDHPWGAINIAVAVTPDGRILGHHAAYPVRYYDASSAPARVITALVMADSMTSPAVRHIGSRGTNVLHRLRQHHYAHFCEGRVGFILGFITGKSKRYYLRMNRGERLLEEAPFRVLELTRGAILALREHAVQRNGLEVRRVHVTGSQWDSLFDQASPGYGMLAQRDSTYVNWRYLRCPDIDYYVYALYESGRLVGWSVFRQEGDRLLWGDGLLLEEHARSFAVILDYALKQRAHCYSKTVEGWFSNHPSWWRDVPVELGFESRPEPEAMVTLCMGFVEEDPTERLRAHLYYTKGDSDLF